MPWIDDEIQSILWNNATHTHIHLHISILWCPCRNVCVRSFKSWSASRSGKTTVKWGKTLVSGIFYCLTRSFNLTIIPKGVWNHRLVVKIQAVISVGVHFRSRDASRMMIYHNYLQYFLYNNMMYIYQYIYIYIHTLNDLFPTDSELLCSQTFLNPQAAYQKIANPCPRVKAQQICQTNGKCM